MGATTKAELEAMVKRLQRSLDRATTKIAALDKSLGRKTGFGEPLTCAFEVHKPGVDAYGTLTLVRL